MTLSRAPLLISRHSHAPLPCHTIQWIEETADEIDDDDVWVEDGDENKRHSCKIIYIYCVPKKICCEKYVTLLQKKKQWERHMHERTRGRRDGRREYGRMGRNAGVRVRVYIAPIARIISSVFVMFHTQKHTYLWYNIGDGIFIESRARQPSSFGHEQRQRWWKDSVSRPPPHQKVLLLRSPEFCRPTGCSLFDTPQQQYRHHTHRQPVHARIHNAPQFIFARLIFIAAD